MGVRLKKWIPIIIAIVTIIAFSGCALNKSKTKIEQNQEKNKIVDQNKPDSQNTDNKNEQDTEKTDNNQVEKTPIDKNTEQNSVEPGNIIPNLGPTSNKHLAWWIRRVPGGAPGIDPEYKTLMERYNGLYIGNITKKQVALTFDVGDAGNDSVPALLDMLEKHNVRVNFFVAGKWLEKYPQVFKRMLADKNLIGNHSYSHPDFTTISAEQLVDEINKTNNLIINNGGNKPVFFRLPFGYFSETVLNKIYSMGYYNTFWGISMVDWNPMPQEQLIHGVIDYLHDGAIVILHVTPEGVKALDTTIPEIQAKGYELVTLDQLISK